MSAAERYVPRYTVADYLQWEGDWGLWDGIAIAMSPAPFGRHQAIVANLLHEIRRSLDANACHARVVSVMDWIVRRDTVVRPDVVVICGLIPDRHLESPPALIVEVLSDATRDRDKTYKKQRYDEQGICAYLMVDPVTETIEGLSRGKSNALEPQSCEDVIELTLCDDGQIKLHRIDIFRR